MTHQKAKETPFPVSERACKQTPMPQEGVRSDVFCFSGCASTTAGSSLIVIVIFIVTSTEMGKTCVLLLLLQATARCLPTVRNILHFHATLQPRFLGFSLFKSIFMTYISWPFTVILPNSVVLVFGPTC